MTIADGLDRVLQTKKDGAFYNPATGQTTEGMNVSGRVVYDSMGRVNQQGQPQFETGNVLRYQGAVGLVNPTVTSYDYMGRVVKKSLPDKSTIDISYRFEGGTLVTRTTDPERKIREEYRDARDRIVKVRQYLSGASIDTTYRYNPIGEILSVTDSGGNEIVSDYDTLGRRTSLITPDTGRTDYFYDVAGNLNRKVDENLRTKAESIRYEYDYNRLREIVYPESPHVTYTYGARGHSEAGRLTRVSNGSGVKTYTYGKLGEQTGMSRTVHRLSSASSDYSTNFSYRWDYLGRMDSITYPNAEVLTYHYDSGGRIESVRSEISGNTFEYIKHIGYDQFGQRNSIVYGNGIQTTYTYQPERRWIENIRTADATGRILQDKAYRFDRLGNILQVADEAGTRSAAQSYRYDDLYRLTGATGTSTDTILGAYQPQTSYAQDFAYDELGRITHKASSALKMPQQIRPAELNYESAYIYDPVHPHEAVRIGDQVYRYDANANVIKIINLKGVAEGVIPARPMSAPLTSVPSSVQYAQEAYGRYRSSDESPSGGGGGENSTAKPTYYAWDEENRLVDAEVAGNHTSFRYDEAGNRAIKTSESSETLYAGAMWQLNCSSVDHVATMHIFMGQMRIASKLVHPQESVSADITYQQANTFYYHTDHLGSSNVISDHNGNEFKCYEYTPDGEMWWERGADLLSKITYKFSGKEMDPETGLYYYGARYLNPVTGLWMSADPAMGLYLPVAPVSADARRHNQSLPGMGGLFNPVNLVSYAFAGDNPAKYSDPSGSIVDEPGAAKWMNEPGAQWFVCASIPKSGGVLDSGGGLRYHGRSRSVRERSHGYHLRSEQFHF